MRLSGAWGKNHRNVRIVFIGAGNLATHLSKALKDAGFEIVQVYSRTESSASRLAGALHVPYTTHVSHIIAHASLYIISVSDDVIGSIAEQLPLTNGMVVHTAGSVPMSILSGKHANYGVLYPLQTFSGIRAVDFSGIPVFLEANTPNNLQLLRDLAGTISNRVYDAVSEERRQLHVAAVFGCNFVNHLYYLAAQIAQQAGFDFEVLSPLILETAYKAVASGNPQDVQTGPAVRGDREVMRKHMELLAALLQWQEIYTMLSKSIEKTV